VAIWPFGKEQIGERTGGWDEHTESGKKRNGEKCEE
jgi:hypothetical protein